MTTKPKASKFRVRRATPLSQAGAKPSGTNEAEVPADAPRPPEAPAGAAASGGTAATPEATAAPKVTPRPRPAASGERTARPVPPAAPRPPATEDKPEAVPGSRPAAAAATVAAGGGVVSVVKRRAEDLARRKAEAESSDTDAATPVSRSAAPAPAAPRPAEPTAPASATAPRPAAPRPGAPRPSEATPPAAARPATPSAPPASASSPDTGAAPTPRPAAATGQVRPGPGTDAGISAPLNPGQPLGTPGRVEPAQAGEVASARETRAETDIDAIRREGLTGRQLRMARRVAQKYGIAATSDFDAVRQLRQQGIDPFERSNMLQLVVPEGGGDGDGEPPVRLPQTVPVPPMTLPSTELRPAERRAAEISQLQQDLAKRRRKRMMLLVTRLFFFVFAPTFLAGWYFFVIATPMYAAKSEFLILQADNQGGGGLGGLLSGTQFATNQDSIAVQSYLQSKDAMLRLDRDVGFKSHFTQPWIDPIQRLEADPSNEEAYKIYKRNVKIGYDPTEGVIRMEVAAADPQVASQFSENLIEYAEERVDELSRRKREDGMATAQASLERAKLERREAQQRLVELQEGTFVDPEGIIAGLRTQINNYEVQLNEKELQLAALLDNSRPNSARVEGVRGDVERLKALLAELNSKMTEATSGDSSLAAKAAQIQMAQADLATADLFLQSALQNEKQTELEANRQVRYLTTSVRPVAPEDPSYPRAFENTLLAFLIFSGIYLMISLTASILREQVSA